MKLSKNNSGQRLWKKANKIIPGGNGLLSKRPERYVPDLWPIYFSKAKGCYIWDLDGNKYIDMAQNGIGSAILGYSDPDVNKAVYKVIKNSINTTLNPPEEVELAEFLLKLNPKMDMVKFAKGGGEAMSIAIRIARTFTKKETILFSGYHGWPDWYLAANLQDSSNLNDHLIPGLSPAGVPAQLKGTSVPFFYNDVDDFKKKLKSNLKNLAAVVIEGARYDPPDKNFIKTIAEECKIKKIPLIVDEITSGFRICNSGTYVRYGYTPDIVVYGKALGNGFPISAIVGNRTIMESSTNSFLSSTMWTERVGFAAAIATLKKITKLKLYKHLIIKGEAIANIWLKLSVKHDLKIQVSSFYPLVTFKFCYQNMNNELATLFTQEMLKKGILAAQSVYVTASHNEKILQVYENKCDMVFKIISTAISSKNINTLLESRPRYDSFARLNKTN